MNRFAPIVCLLFSVGVARGQTPVRLDEAVSLALESDETLRQAAAAVAAAEARVMAAQAAACRPSISPPSTPRI
jgi:outer membrane protein TolC